MRGIVYLVALLSALWMFYDIWLVNKRLSNPMRLLWTVFAFIFSLGAAIIYFIEYKTNLFKR